MPRGDGTGPSGQGPGTGRGMGQGRGKGRMGWNRAGAGPGGNCICPNCGTKVAHKLGKPCLSMTCFKCGEKMARE